ASPARWCRVKTRRWSSVSSLSRRPRTSGPAARSNRPAASASASRPPGRLDLPGQLAEDGVLEHRVQGQFDPEPAADAGDDLDGPQRTAPQFKEVVVGPDPFDAQQLRPDVGQDLLGPRPRCHIRPPPGPAPAPPRADRRVDLL